jgi:hypothetical protein
MYLATIQYYDFEGKRESTAEEREGVKSEHSMMKIHISQLGTWRLWIKDSRTGWGYYLYVLMADGLAFDVCAVLWI